MNTTTKLSLVIVRHGRTKYNDRQITQGQLDVPLDEIGFEQARKAGIALQQDHFDCVYSSDLSRAICTTSEIIKLNNRSDNSQLGVKRDILLREKKYGIMEDKPWSDLKSAANDAGFLGQAEEKRFVPTGGESDDEVFKRAKRFLENLCADFRDVSELSRNPTFNILIVSHGMLITQMINYLVSKYHCRGIPDAKLRTILETGNIPNTGISRFELHLKEQGKLNSVSCSMFCSEKHLTEISKET